VQTEFDQVAQRNSAKREKSSPTLAHVSVEEVVRAGLRAIERDKPLVVPGLIMKIAMLMVRLTPMPLLRLASRFSM
jgi:short-subunit dehydrogenase